MKKAIIIATISCIVAATATRCTYNNGEDLYPNVNCDTTNISFATQVYPIIKTQCNNCHAQSIQQGGVSLEDYASIQEYADNGTLSSTINANTGASNAMPPAGKMPNCSVDKISAWVKQGAKDN
jgi:cytochrome c5